MNQPSQTLIEVGQEVSVGPHELPGILAIPAQAKGLVLFAHGSGSSRLSSRNQYVAKVLYDAGIATLLFDLLGEDEEADRGKVFDILHLAKRLQEATDWVQEQPRAKDKPASRSPSHARRRESCETPLRRSTIPLQTPPRATGSCPTCSVSV